LTCRATVCPCYRPREVVHAGECPAPVADSSRARIRMSTAAVNFPDVPVTAFYRATV
jgi:NADPH:quinone reductase